MTSRQVIERLEADGLLRIVRKPAKSVPYLCIHDHKHRSQAAMDRCEDGRSGAATGSRLALR